MTGLTGNRVTKLLLPVGCGAALILAGCGNLANNLPTGMTGSSTVDTTADTKSATTLSADVTALDTETGLPLTLSGTLSGGYVGTYDESILEVLYDNNAVPMVAISRSVFTLEEPDVGTLTSVNTILIVDTLVADDGSGTMVPIGLATGASGEIVHGTGAFEGATGKLHTDSTLSFATGEFGLGSATTAITIELTP